MGTVFFSAFTTVTRVGGLATGGAGGLAQPAKRTSERRDELPGKRYRIEWQLQYQ
jgi:hypothetical protein